MASRILLADDSITIQKVVNLTFADEGIEVIAVSNGDLAERRLAEVSPDLVLADIFMPGKNGYELCEAIKDNSQFRNVPVVLLVGAFEPFDQAEARRVRADAHLTKPFESRTLVETVRRLISASWRTATGPTAPMPAADDGHDETLAATPDGTTAAPISSQLAGRLDLSAMSAASVAPSNPQVRNTGELASPSPDAQHDVLELEMADACAPEGVSANPTNTSEPFEPFEFSPDGEFSPAEVAPSFDLDMRESHSNEAQEFGTHTPIDHAPSQDPISFETVPSSALHEANISGSGEGENWFNTGSFESSRVERPSDDGGGWRVPTNGSPLNYQAPDFNLQTDTGYSASEAATETSCATLLAVDEPLGDVLFDDAVSVDSVPPLSMSSSDSLGLEFGEAEHAQAELAASTQFDLVEFVEAPTAEASPAVEEAFEQVAPEAVEHVAPDAVEHVMPVTGEHAIAQEPAVEQVAMESVAPTPSLDPQQVPQGLAGDLDWTTPRAASYSTAQLESVVMPIDTAAYLVEKSGGETARQPETAEEASFTTPATWTEEEARFTPIDIEAVAVEDALLEESSAPAPDRLPDSTAVEQTLSSDVTVVGESAAGSSNEPAAHLSSAAIEEIVRRVVAEMSESVVREVAWEVVPDCVERVIEQLTRESLSKRA